MKTKTMKRLAAAVAAITMMSAVPITMANAGSIKIGEYTNDASDKDNISRSYKAYQIFTGEKQTLNSQTVLTGLDWGNGVDKNKLLSANGLLNTSLSDNLKSKLSGLTSGSTASEVASKFETISSDSDLAFELTRVISNCLTATATAVTGGASEAVSVNDGYYLVVDVTDLSGKDSAFSANYLMVADDVNITPKVDRPTLDKVIVDNGTEVEANTAVAGDTITYKIKTTIPKMTGYNKYYFIVEDNITDGLTFNDDITVTIKNTSDKTLTKTTDYKSTGETFYVETKTDADQKSDVDSIKIVFNNFIQYKELHGKTIEITYTATLNSDASYSSAGSSANKNSARLVYSNKPGFEYKGIPDDATTADTDESRPDEPNKPETPSDDKPTEPTEDTLWDDVVTYLTKLVITKKDGSGNTLGGAGFTVYSDENCSSDKAVGTEVTSGADGLVVFNLDEGTYWIKETTVPNGYNGLDSPLKVIISASENETNAGWVIDSNNIGTFSLTSDTGIYNTTVVNNAGATLPSTGGIGTTIFYVSGGALILGAGVVLITKKRMSAKEDR